MTQIRWKFSLGQVVATPAAIEVLKSSGQDAFFFLNRHAAGDWGDMDAHDSRVNDQALCDGSRIFSAYSTLKGERLWLITEAAGDDGLRASTCILLPQEY